MSQAPHVGFTAWHITLAGSSWPRWGEKGLACLLLCCLSFSEVTYALDSFHGGGVGLPSPWSLSWCSSDVPGLEQSLGALLFPPTSLGLSANPQHILTLFRSARKEETVTVYPADVVLFEGILAFYSQEVRDLFRMKLFVDTDADTRLSRRGEARTCRGQRDRIVT